MREEMLDQLDFTVITALCFKGADFFSGRKPQAFVKLMGLRIAVFREKGGKDIRHGFTGKSVIGFTQIRAVADGQKGFKHNQLSVGIVDKPYIYVVVRAFALKISQGILPVLHILVAPDKNTVDRITLFPQSSPRRFQPYTHIRRCCC